MKEVIVVIYCMMLKKITESKAMSCLQAAGLDSKDVRECAIGKEGHDMHYRDGRETMDLVKDTSKGRLHHVPWITMNGERRCFPGKCNFAEELCEAMPHDERIGACDDFQEK